MAAFQLGHPRIPPHPHALMGLAPPCPRPQIHPMHGAFDNISTELEGMDMWKQFERIGTEMVITKNGR